MRILHVTPYYAPAWPWGGVVAAVAGLAGAQARAGHRVTVLTTDTLGPGLRGAAGTTVRDGVEVRRVATRAPVLRARLNLSWPRGLGAAARRLVDDRACDVVHCHELRSVETVVASRAAAAAGVPVLLSPHGTLSRGTGRTALKRAWDAVLTRPVLRRVRHLMALTPLEAREARSLWAAHGLVLEDARLSVIPNGVEPQPPVAAAERAAARRALGLDHDARVALVLGRLHPRKRVPLLVEAFAEVAAVDPRARLLVAGPDAGALGAVRAAIARHLLADRVVLAGMVSGGARREVLAASDCLALVGAGEGLPMAALEALASGLPLVLGEPCGLDEAVHAGAARVAGEDPRALAAALTRSLDEVAAGDAPRRRAREVAQSRFAWPPIVARIDQVLRALGPSPRPGAAGG